MNVRPLLFAALLACAEPAAPPDAAVADAGLDASPFDAAADAEPADAEPADAEPADAEPADAEPADAAIADAAIADATVADAEPADAVIADAGSFDAAFTDAEPADATLTDAGAADAGPPPSPPPSLVRYLTGDPADRDVTPRGPALVLMGGGAEVDEAFHWWRGPLAGGDVVVLRTSGADGYNDYLYADIGGADSVETLLVTTRALADDPYVVDRVTRAEGVFLAGGDQSTYLATWRGAGVERALAAAWARGAVLGGTSAGAVVLSGLVFGAHQGSVGSSEALADPLDPALAIDPAWLDLPPMRGVLVDTHFAARDRFGRLVAFLARAIADGLAPAPLGLGLDERAAVVLDAQGRGTVLGRGAVYVLATAGPAESLRPFTFRGLGYRILRAGDALTLPSGAAAPPVRPAAVEAGVLTPHDPY